METGITNIYELPGSKGGITLEVNLTEQYDILQNISHVTLGLRVKSSMYYNYIYYLTGSVKVNGVTLVNMDSVVPTHYAKPPAVNTYCTVDKWSAAYTGSPWVLENIPHLSDGSKSVQVEVTVKGYTSGGGGSGWSVADSRTVALTHIPRASTVGATDAFIGAVSAVSVVRRSAEYVHSIAYRFGELTGFLAADGSLLAQEAVFTAGSIPFAIPEAFYDQIPNSPSGVCTLTCTTYRGAEQIGQSQSCAFTVTAKEELCRPELTATVIDSNPVTLALTGDENTLVRFHSVAACTMTAEAKNGASVVSRVIAGEETNGTLQIAEVETGSFLFTVTDSRGYSNSVTVEKTLVPYIHLTVNARAKRTDPTSGRTDLTGQGNCFAGTFGLQDNGLTLSCSVDGGASISLNPQWEENAYTLQQLLTGLDYQTSHTVLVEASDQLELVSQTLQVGKGIPVFDWGEGDFCFHVPVSLPALTVEGQSLADYIRAIMEGG